MSGKQEKTVTNLNIEVECLLTATNVLMFSKLFDLSHQKTPFQALASHEMSKYTLLGFSNTPHERTGEIGRVKGSTWFNCPPPPYPVGSKAQSLAAAEAESRPRRQGGAQHPVRSCPFVFLEQKPKVTVPTSKMLTNSYQVCWGSGFWSLNNKAVDTKEDPHSMRNRIIHVDQKAQHSKDIYIFNKPVKS